MSGDKPTDIVVFYAWQDDLPKDTNKNLIRYALRDASSLVESWGKIKNLRLVPDEATRGKSGSPNIPATILAKIDAADIFVCDITPINEDATQKLPNPNVIFELGYAASRLGWERVIMIFNEAFGKFPDDMPFDFDRHRASPYSFAQPSKHTPKKELAKRRQPLVDMLCEALKAVIENDPQKTFRVQSMTEADKKKARDVRNLKWLMSTVHIPTIDNHIDELPYKIYDRVLSFWYDFDSVATSSLFHLYDKEAKRLVIGFKEAWGSTLSFTEFYHHPGHGEAALFMSALDLFTPEQNKAYNAVKRRRKSMFKRFHALLDYIRANYLEIDLDGLSHKAWVDYVDYEKKMAAKLGEPTSEKRKSK